MPRRLAGSSPSKPPTAPWPLPNARHINHLISVTKIQQNFGFCGRALLLVAPRDRLDLGCGNPDVWFRVSDTLSSTLYRRGVVSKSILCVSVLLVLGATSASAEEMAMPPASFITRQPAFLAWSGLYFGINGGYGWGNAYDSYLPNDPASLAGVGAAKSIGQSGFNRDGGLAGGQVGFNWQSNSLWLAGVEADYQWSDVGGTSQSPFHLANVGSTSNLSTFTARSTVESFGTLRARIGALPTAALLLYGTGGLAYGELKESLNLPTSATGTTTVSGFSYSCSIGPACFSGSQSQMRLGWTAGVGAELAITTYLTFKTEVLYVHLQAPSATATATAVTALGPTPSSFTANFSPVYFGLIRGGLNYRF